MHDDLMAATFPAPGPMIRLAYTDLYLAQNGTDEQRAALGDVSALPRPWDPGTVTLAPLRAELWDWLEEFVVWLNHEYVWSTGTEIPPCWPHHPHLVHELAVLCDLRYRAGTAYSSDPLEDWHRYSLPMFTDRLRIRAGQHCSEGHQEWPARASQRRHASEAAVEDRIATFGRDVEAVDLDNSPHDNDQT